MLFKLSEIMSELGGCGVALKRIFSEGLVENPSKIGRAWR